MEQKLAEALTPLMKQFSNSITQVVEAAQREFPLLIQELLRWEFCISLIQFSCAFLIFSLCVIGMIKCIKSAMKRFEDYKVALSVFFFVIGLFGGMMPMTLTLNWLKIWIAPRIFLIEYVANLFKTSGAT